MDELYIARGAGPADGKIQTFMKDDYQKYPDFPARTHISNTSPTLVEFKDAELLFYCAGAIGRSSYRRQGLTVRASGIFYTDITPDAKQSIKTVICTGSESLDRYIGKPNAADGTPEISTMSPLSAFVDSTGAIRLAWVSTTGRACISTRPPDKDEWNTQRIELPTDNKIQSLQLMEFPGRLTAIASVESQGLVLFTFESRRWRQKAVIFEDSLYPFVFSATARPDGKMVVAAVPSGTGATHIRIAVVDPASGKVDK